MAFDIYGKNEEFAVSTGTNVNYSSGKSRFDYPPTSSLDLVITTHDGDPTPRLFSVGDQYTLSWAGNGGGGSIQNATVIRSDLSPDGQGGIIVLQGTLANGGLAQVVWTPGFDLESWYFANFTYGIPPVFNTGDQNANYTHGYICFAAEARISGPHGPIPAIDLAAGDRVDTVDHGVQTLRWVGVSVQSGHGAAAPVRFAPGALGNEVPLRLSQNHRLLYRSVTAELYFGSSEVLVPARALVNGRDVRLAPCDEVTFVHVLLDRHEVLLAEGVPCESLFLGGEARQVLEGCHADDSDARILRAMLGNRHVHATPARPLLTAREARALTGAPTAASGAASQATTL